jgi:hypothetical protein
MPAHTPNLIALLEKGVAASTDLEAALGLSQSTISRLVRQQILEGRIIRLGATRGARYGLLRLVSNIGSHWTLRRVNEKGNVDVVGALYALASDQYWFSPATPSGSALAGVTDGIPYFLQDQRPGGFLGRAVPLRYPGLELPQRVVDWHDDHYLQYLTRRGADTVGDLILGDESFNEYIELQKQRTPIPLNARSTQFPRLAQQVMSGGLPGSSAHGEHPKFAALLQRTDDYQQVLVKFSPPIKTAVGRRWADLLVAEHLAHQTPNEGGITAPHSEIHEFSNVQFLQLDRFDRNGINGRVGVTSLLSIDTTRYGMLDNWVASATRLHWDQRIDAPTLEAIRLVYTFGGLIANTDRHFGNLALYDHYSGKLKLAPVYDMLPMLFAPQNDQIVPREFTAPDPTAETLTAYPRARELAEQYWRRISTDRRISTEFRKIAKTCGESVEALPRTGAYAYRGGTTPK